MSGAIRSKWYRIHNRVYPTPVDAAQPMKNTFAAIVNYFDTHGGFNRIASYYGRLLPTSGDRGKGVGPMSDWRGNPWDGCWAVWRAVSASVQYDVAVMASDVQDIGSYPGGWISETIFGSGTGVQFVAAYHASGAWNGTTNNNGLDTFTTPWKTNSQTTIRSNGTSGGNAGTRKAVGRMTDISSHFAYTNKAYNIFITGDNDTTFFAIQKDLATLKYETYNVAVVGLYDPSSGSYNVPLTQFKLGSDNKDATRGNTVGETTAATGGGGINTVSGSTVRAMRVEYPSFMLSDPDRFSRTLEEDRFWEFPVRLYRFEASNYVYAGTLELMRVGAASAGGAFRFYNFKSRLAVPVRTPDDTTGGFLVVTLPWNSSSLSPREW